METRVVALLTLVGWQLGFATCGEESNQEEEYVAHIQQIRTKLFDPSRYDSAQRALHNGSATTNVTVFFFPASYANLEDDWLTVALYLCIYWQDDNLVWNKGDYGGVEYISIFQNEAWFPDVTLINTNPREYASGRDTAYLDHNGSIWDCHPVKVRVPCVMDLTYYPRDRHLCPLRFSSPTYLEDEIRILGFRIGDKSEPSSEWSVTLQEPSYGVALERGYVDMTFEMKRRGTHHVYTVTLPCIASVILMLLVFWTPVDSDRRLWLACANLFLLTVMLGRMGRLLARSATVPNIVFFLGSAVAIQAAVTLAAIMVLNVASTQTKTPECVVRFLTGPVGVLVCSRTNLSASEGPEDNGFTRRGGEGGKRGDWLLLAQVLDRLFFGVFVVVALSVMPWWSWACLEIRPYGSH